MRAMLVDSITCSLSVKNMKKTGIAGHKKGIFKYNGTTEAILQFSVIAYNVFSLWKKNILYCFTGCKYSEQFDLIFSCLLWTVRIIYLNLLLLLFYLRETLLFQGSFGFQASTNFNFYSF